MTTYRTFDAAASHAQTLRESGGTYRVRSVRASGGPPAFVIVKHDPVSRRWQFVAA